MQGHSTHSPHLPGVSKTDAMVPILQLQHPLLSLHVGLRVIPGAHVRGPKRMKHCLGKGSDPNRLFLHNLGSQCIYREVPPALSPFPLSLQLYIPSLGPSSAAATATKSLRSCLTLRDPMNCSPPDCSVREISQPRILEQIALSFFKGSSQPRDQTHASCEPPAL